MLLVFLFLFHYRDPYDSVGYYSHEEKEPTTQWAARGRNSSLKEGQNWNTLVQISSRNIVTVHFCLVCQLIYSIHPDTGFQYQGDFCLNCWLCIESDLTVSDLLMCFMLVWYWQTQHLYEHVKCCHYCCNIYHNVTEVGRESAWLLWGSVSVHVLIIWNV